MNKHIEEFKRYLENQTFDSGDPDCKTVLDQLYYAYAESHENDPPGIRESFKELESFLEILPLDDNNAVFTLCCRIYVAYERKAFIDGFHYGIQLMKELFPFFDKKALDAGRFFFGNPDTEVYIFQGHRTLTDFIEELEENKFVADMEETASVARTGFIPEGSRNSTISHAAGKILKRWGDTPEAYEKFMEAVSQCSPPLPDQEVNSTWKSALKFFHEKVKKQPGYVPPAEYNKPAVPQWEPPIPFTQHTLPAFPVNAFPPAIRDYVLAVAETTQTPVDMAATAALAVLALCQQGKDRIKGKDDWIEPLNLFTVIVAEPSERKSAVISHMTGAVHRFEAEYNKQHSGAVERSRMEKRILEKQQRKLNSMP